MLMIFTMRGCLACAEQKKEITRAGVAAHVDVIDVDKQPAIADLYKVKATPTLVGIKNGRVAYRHEGAVDAAVLKSVVRRLGS